MHEGPYGKCYGPEEQGLATTALKSNGAKQNDTKKLSQDAKILISHHYVKLHENPSVNHCRINCDKQLTLD